MTTKDKDVAAAVAALSEKWQAPFSSDELRKLDELVTRWAYPKGMEAGAYRDLMQGNAAKTAASRSYSAGEHQFETGGLKVWIKKEHLPIAVRNHTSIQEAVAGGRDHYKCYGPRGVEEEYKRLPKKWLKKLLRPIVDGGGASEKSEAYFSTRKFLSKSAINEKYYYLCEKNLVHEVMISDYDDLDTNPRRASSSGLHFASRREADLFVERAKDYPKLAEEETLPPQAFDTLARKIIAQDLDDVETIPSNFSLLVRVCELTQLDPERKDLLPKLRNRHWTILRNAKLFDPENNVEEEARRILNKLCLFPNLRTFEKNGETGASERVDLLKAAINLLLRHIKPKYESKFPGWKAFAERLQSLGPRMIEAWVDKKQLTRSTPFKVMTVGETKTLLDHLAKNDLELYHWCVLALATGWRIGEVEAFIEDPTTYTVEDGLVVELSRLVTKTVTDKFTDLPLVAILIYRNAERFTLRPFEKRDLDSNGAADNIRRELMKAKQPVDFYRRRMRTTCATMLAKCQNETNPLHQRASYFTILDRGGWMEEATARVHYIKSLPGTGILPDVLFKLRDPSERIYFERKETYRHIEAGQEVQAEVPREYDLLEGQTCWDAWLLKHFIETHEQHIKAEYPPPVADQKFNELKALVLEWQDVLLKRVGWERKHDPGRSRVVNLIQEGYLVEAEAHLEILIDAANPKRINPKRVIRDLVAELGKTREAFMDLKDNPRVLQAFEAMLLSWSSSPQLDKGAESSADGDEVMEAEVVQLKKTGSSD